jgi:hypothetical protein
MTAHLATAQKKIFARRPGFLPEFPRNHADFATAGGITFLLEAAPL